jgi:hypothetical protein
VRFALRRFLSSGVSWRSAYTAIAHVSNSARAAAGAACACLLRPGLFMQYQTNL